jgi:hypothetical protein
MNQEELLPQAGSEGLNNKIVKARCDRGDQATNGQHQNRMKEH